MSLEEDSIKEPSRINKEEKGRLFEIRHGNNDYLSEPLG
jgi:hypothetical protein